MSESTRKPGFATTCIHAGQEPEPVTGAVAVPIFQTSTYVQEAFGKPRAGLRVRAHEEPHAPRAREAARRARGRRRRPRVRVRHGGRDDAHAHASSKAGDHVLVSRNTYGGTYRFFSKVLANFGVTFAYVDTTDADAVRKAVTPATRMLFVETPDEPDDGDLRPRGPRASSRRPRAPTDRREDPRRRRQHVRDAVLPEASRARLRRRRPLHDEVPERPLGLRRRRGDLRGR